MIILSIFSSPSNDRKTITVEHRRSEEQERKSALIKSAAGGIPNSTAHKFDGVLWNSSQEEVYEAAAQEVVNGVIDGYNGTIFAYGQTGAGKTYSMTGDTVSYSQRGIIPRAIFELFRAADERVDSNTTFRVSYLEIYNEVIYDLLSEEPESADNLVIVDEGGMTTVKGLSRREVTNEEAALAMFFRGENIRSTAQHCLNRFSSRSHCIFTVEMETSKVGDTSERVIISKLHLVDLAGSERTKKTQVTGQTLKEANFINKSLSFLEQTVAALGRREAHIPFRQTKLTAALKDALGGNSKSVMIACVWPEERHAEESASTLRFASRVRLLQTEPTINERTDPALMVRRYQKKIEELKRELAMRDSLAGREAVKYDEFSAINKADLERIINDYLKGNIEVDEVPVESLFQIREAFMTFKKLYLASPGWTKATTVEIPVEGAVGSGHMTNSGPMNGETAKSDNVVGEEDDAKGFHVGVAPSSLRPPPSAIATPEGGVNMRNKTHANNSPGTQVRTVRAQTPQQHGLQQQIPHFGMTPTAYGFMMNTGFDEKASAFEYFKNDVQEGQTLFSLMREAQIDVRSCKTEMKEASDLANAAKKDIDKYTEIIKSRRMFSKNDENRSDNDEVIDAEDFIIFKSLKASKQKYRDNVSEIRHLKEKLTELLEGLAMKRAEMLGGFDSWYESEGNHFGIMGEDDELDAAEQFDKLELDRVMAADPESLAFYAAKKTMRRAKNQKSDKVMAMRLEARRHEKALISTR